MQKRQSNQKNRKPGGGRRRKPTLETRKDDYIYFDDGSVVETLPGVTFKIKVKRALKNQIESEAPETDNSIQIVCSLRAKLIKKRVMIIKGDTVVVEVNPTDMYYDEADQILKGIIIQRK